MIWFLANWRLFAAMLVGAILCAPVAHCSGKRAAKIEAAARLEAASAKVIKVAKKAEIAAAVVDAANRAETVKEVIELREIVREVGTDDKAGPAVAGVLERLRRQSSR